MNIEERPLAVSAYIRWKLRREDSGARGFQSRVSRETTLSSAHVSNFLAYKTNVEQVAANKIAERWWKRPLRDVEDEAVEWAMTQEGRDEIAKSGQRTADPSTLRNPTEDGRWLRLTETNEVFKKEARIVRAKAQVPGADPPLAIVEGALDLASDELRSLGNYRGHTRDEVRSAVARALAEFGYGAAPERVDDASDAVSTAVDMSEAMVAASTAAKDAKFEQALRVPGKKSKPKR